MSDVATAITPNGALRLIAQHGGKHKTAATLHEEASQFEKEAFRLERIAVGATGGNRKKARSLGRARKAAQQRGNATCCRMAAKEIERRKVSTVGQALRPWPLRIFCVLRGVWDGAEGTIARSERPLMDNPTTD